MGWWRFFFWNAAGGVIWATTIGLVSYYLGDAAASAIGTYGLIAAGGTVVLTALGYLIVRRVEKRIVSEPDGKPTDSTETSSPHR